MRMLVGGIRVDVTRDLAGSDRGRAAQDVGEGLGLSFGESRCPDFADRGVPLSRAKPVAPTHVGDMNHHLDGVSAGSADEGARPPHRLSGDVGKPVRFLLDPDEHVASPPFLQDTLVLSDVGLRDQGLRRSALAEENEVGVAAEGGGVTGNLLCRGGLGPAADQDWVGMVAPATGGHRYRRVDDPDRSGGYPVPEHVARDQHADFGAFGVVGDDGRGCSHFGRS